MQKHRYKISFVITVIIYLLLAYIIWYASESFNKPVQQTLKAKTITLSLSEFNIQQDIDELNNKPIFEKPSQIEQLQDYDISKEEKQDIKEVSKKTPLKETEKKTEDVEKISQTLTTTKTIIKKSVKRDTKKTKLKHKKHKKIKRVLKSNTKRYKNKTKAKTTLLAHIRYKINHAKIYPKAAKRRHIQGKVYAKFRVLKNGKVTNIKLNGSSIFFNATKKAIQKAFPIDTKGATTLLPLDVSVTIRYNLTQN